MRGLTVTIVVALLWISTAEGQTPNSEPLPKIGEAPPFALTAQDGRQRSLASLRGKVVAVSFIYTWCPDVCPMLTATMANVRDELGDHFGTDIVFVTITFDPDRDTVEVLRSFAEAFEADPKSWMFLTGKPQNIATITKNYGVVTFPGQDGAIDHNLLTTLVDRNGVMRVQYAGWEFSPDEFREDLLSLAEER